MGEESCECIRYEGYGPGGAAVIVDCGTSDRSRTAGELRHVFASHGGNLGAEGAVSYLFNPAGVIALPAGTDERRAREQAFEAGAEDVLVRPDGVIEVLTEPSQLEAIRESLVRLGFDPGSGAITERAAVTTVLAGKDAQSMLRLVEALKALGDVRNVYSNAEIPDEVLARFSA